MRGSGKPKPLRVLALPNPQFGPQLRLAVELEGPADRLSVKLYTKSMAAVTSLECKAAFSQGWNQAAFSLPEPLPSGLYYAVVTGHGPGGEEEKGAEIGKILRLE